MIMTSLKHFLLTGGLFLFLGLVACATPPESFEYKPDNELKPGRGVLTGDQGAFIIYGEPDTAKEKPPNTKDAETTKPATP